MHSCTMENFLSQNVGESNMRALVEFLKANFFRGALFMSFD